MTAMSEWELEPEVALWEEPGTLLHSINVMAYEAAVTGKRGYIYSISERVVEDWGCQAASGGVVQVGDVWF